MWRSYKCVVLLRYRCSKTSLVVDAIQGARAHHDVGTHAACSMSCVLYNFCLRKERTEPRGFGGWRHAQIPVHIHSREVLPDRYFPDLCGRYEGTCAPTKSHLAAKTSLPPAFISLPLHFYEPVSPSSASSVCHEQPCIGSYC
jgi:hypothetical protein